MPCHLDLGQSPTSVNRRPRSIARTGDGPLRTALNDAPLLRFHPKVGRRNVAQVRRAAGAVHSRQPLNGAYSGKCKTKSPQEIRSLSWLTTTRDGPYKPLIRRAVRYRRDGAPLKLLTYVWDRTSKSDRRFKFRRLPGSPGRGPLGPGLFDR